MNIIIYRKSGCPWAAAVIGFLNEIDISHEVRNFTSHPAYAEELKAKSKLCKSPTVEIDRRILEDASVEDVAAVLGELGFVL